MYIRLYGSSTACFEYRDRLHSFYYFHWSLAVVVKYSCNYFRVEKVGKSFTVYSFISILLTTLFLGIIPIQALSKDIILNAVFGGVILAVGVGITLKFGASTGGLDIIALILSRVKDRPIGTYMFILNAIIIVLAGLLYGAEKSLYTLVTLYTTTRVIDVIHTRHVKLTAMIVTKKGVELRKAIHAKLVRGITAVPAKAASQTKIKKC